jgi:hypothetical protein
VVVPPLVLVFTAFTCVDVPARCADAGETESGPALEFLGQPGDFQRGSDYCWPMILPLMSMLSSTTILEPVSGPPSSTR